jgi:hypothetical protein
LNVVVLINPYIFFFEIWWKNLSHLFRTMMVIVEARIHWNLVKIVATRLVTFLPCRRSFKEAHMYWMTKTHIWGIVSKVENPRNVILRSCQDYLLYSALMVSHKCNLPPNDRFLYETGLTICCAPFMYRVYVRILAVHSCCGEFECNRLAHHWLHCADEPQKGETAACLHAAVYVGDCLRSWWPEINSQM